MTTAIKERPILFSGPMVRAILDGHKTQTRRVMKPQPEPSAIKDGCHWWRCKDVQMMVDVEGFLIGDDTTVARCFCPHGNVGERLWVRETFALVNPLAGCDFNGRPDNDGVRYRTTWTKSHHGHWKPSIFMPRWASRITLEITDVRVQRLKDITEEDAKAEGVRCGMADPNGEPYSYVRHFASLWRTINGADSWDANPWVWAITFKRVKP